MGKKFYLLATFAFFLLSGFALAWDGQRKGFIMGLGTGINVHSYTSKEESPEIETRKYDRVNDLGLQLNFKIGYAPTDRLQFHLTSKTSFSGKTTGITGLGADYYLKPNPPSFYFTGVVGISWWGETLLAQYIIYRSDGFRGIGLSGGIGYEFMRNLSAELSLNWGNPSDFVGVPLDLGLKSSPLPDDYITAKRTYNVLSAGLTINALGY